MAKREIWCTRRSRNWTGFPHPMILQNLVVVLTTYDKTTRSTTNLWKFMSFRYCQRLRNAKLRRKLSMNLSGYFFSFRIGSDYFVLWQHAPNKNRGRVQGRSIYFFQAHWFSYPLVLFFHHSRERKSESIVRIIHLRDSKWTLSSFPQYCARKMQLSWIAYMMCGYHCSLYVKCFSSLSRNFRIVVWCRLC